MLLSKHPHRQWELNTALLFNHSLHIFMQHVISLHRELQHVVMQHVLKYILWVMSCYYKDDHTLLVLVCQCTWGGWEVPYPGMDRSRSAGHCRSGRWSRTRAGRRRAPRPCTLPTTAACTERGTRTVPQKRSPAAWRSLGRQNDNINMKSKKRM